MKCEICKSDFKKIDTLLVCANGHTIQNTTEVVHDDVVLAGRTKRIRKTKKERRIYKGDGCKLLRMVLLKLLFEEARSFFNIKDDCMFRYYTGFFEFRNGKLDTSTEVSKPTFSMLVYLAKRIEMERNNQIYLFSDFMNEMDRFDLFTRLVLIKNKYPKLEVAVREIGIYKEHSGCTISSMKTRLDEFTSYYYYTRPFTFIKTSDTGIYEECVESAKYNMRRLIRNDLEILNQYFKRFCDDLGVEITPEIDLYFQKYVYTYDPNLIIFPEYDFVFFISIYFISRGLFENTELEANVLEFLLISKSYFINHVDSFILHLDKLKTPECYIDWRNRRNKMKFISLRGATEFINAFKRYVAADIEEILLKGAEVENPDK